MRMFLSRIGAIFVLLSPLVATAQDASLDSVAKAMGATNVKSIQYSGNGVNFQVGQNYSVPDPIRQTPTPYARVTTQMVADGVWFLSGGSPTAC